MQELRVRIDLMDKKLVLIALCETKPKNFRFERIMAEYNLDGYDLLPLNMRKEDPGRGMILYIQTGLKYSPINMKTSFCEYISVEIDIHKSDKLLATSKYRSQSSSKEDCINLNNLLMKFQINSIHKFSSWETLITQILTGKIVQPRQALEIHSMNLQKQLETAIYINIY